MRKSIFAILAVLLILSNITMESVIFEAKSDNVTIAEASEVGQYFKQCYGDIVDSTWNNSDILGPVVYYAVDGTKVAYEFTVVNMDEPIGYVIISATKDLPPLLEAGEGRSPSSYLKETKNLAIMENLTSSADKPRFLWWGALTYSVQYGEQMKEKGLAIHLQSGRIMSVPSELPVFEVDTTLAEAAWIEVMNKSNQVGTVVRSSNYHWITGVPCYYQQGWSGGHGDDYSQYATWPSCRGTGADPWAKWDGCTPIAGSMILGYWDGMGYTSIPNGEDLLIDDCHHWMHTDFDGFTTGSDIDDGLENLLEEYGYNDFSVRNDGHVAWSDITIHVDNDYPEILSFVFNPTYGNHSVAVVGYIEDGENKQIIIHDTLTASAAWIGWGTFAYPIITMCNPE
ncbi:hypothetical protein Dehly_1552 [Dehalogenimonas lykanthroporepellens BL-DC-9]|nr:hypothetical protein Dehly_1552 [Dehalogenimonas lykanthroporepellens BL-DC-9]